MILPPWNRKIAQWLAPASPAFDLILLLIALACLTAIVIWRERPGLKALLIAFIISP